MEPELSEELDMALVAPARITPTVITIMVDESGCRLVSARPIGEPSTPPNEPCEMCREHLNASVAGLTTVRSEPRAWSLLTAREIQTAELAAAARPNREIAERLGISTRTVENHLSRAYAKLGIATRVELQLLLAVRADRRDEC